jgi:hypothetical protein
VVLHVFRRQPSVGETFEGIEFGPAELGQVNNSDHMPDRIIRVASNLHPVAITLRMQLAHQPLAGVPPDPAIIGFKAGVVWNMATPVANPGAQPAERTTTTRLLITFSGQPCCNNIGGSPGASSDFPLLYAIVDEVIGGRYPGPQDWLLATNIWIERCQLLHCRGLTTWRLTIPQLFHADHR